MPRPERPLDPTVSAIARFAAELRELRQEAGNRSYRVLAKIAHYSPTALSEAAGGERLASLPVTLAYVRACGGDVASWEARWRAIVAETGGMHAGVADAAPCPYGYPMMAGRDRLVEEALVKIIAGRPVVVSGASGAGITTLLRAGIVAALDRGATASWPVMFLTPGKDPLEELVVHLAALLNVTAGPVQVELAEDGRALQRGLRQALVGYPLGTRLVLIVDQFEQVITWCGDARLRHGFLNALETVCDSGAEGVRLVLGVRQDVLRHREFASYPRIAAALGDPLTVGGLDREALRQIITGPAAMVGVSVDGALTGMLMADAHGRRGGTALLVTTLCELWPHRQGQRLTHSGYRAVNGIDGVLARMAENAYQNLDLAEREVARRVLVRLAALGTADATSWLGREEFDDADGVMECLAAGRLIVIGADGVALAHEELSRVWPRFRGWLDSDPDGLRLHRRLAEAAREWERLGRDPGVLLRGSRLTSTLDWHGRGGDYLNRLDKAFLEASRAARGHVRTRVPLAMAALAVTLLGGGAVSGSPVKATVPATMVPVVRETRALQGISDFDGVAVWRDPADPSRSLIIASGGAGLTVFDLAGDIVQQIDGNMENVDVRDEIVAVAASNRRAVHFYRVGPGTGILAELSTVATGLEGDGVCLYRSLSSRRLFLFVLADHASPAGEWLVEQREITPTADGVASSAPLRLLRVPGKIEHCVADDNRGHLYVAEEKSAVWRFDAEPDADPTGRRVVLADKAVLVSDIEGLAMAGPYLLVTSAGDDTTVVYDTGGYRPTRKVSLTGQAQLDGCDDTGALAAMPGAAGADFPAGLLVCHDKSNSEGGRQYGENFKYVDLGRIIQR